MVIQKEEIESLENEIEIFSQLVYLEKADKPSSAIAHNIPMGLLLLTDKHLMFLNSGSRNEKKNFVKTLSLLVADELVVPAATTGSALIDLISSKIKRKEDDEEVFNQYLNNEHSFIVPVEEIVSCERFDRMISFNPKNKFLRIGIIDNNGMKINYCLYKLNPTRTFLPGMQELWEKSIKLVAKNIK